MHRAIAVIGAQWGDEGKGKLVDVLCQNTQCCARFNGGSNAGHTLQIEGKRFALHLLPCGIMNANAINLIGQGVVLHLPSLAKEIDDISEAMGIPRETLEARLRISSRCHITFDYHIAADIAEENRKSLKSLCIGTTKRGIGPSYAAKALRLSLRGCDLQLDREKFERKYHEQLDFFRTAFNLGTYDSEAELLAVHGLRSRFGKLVIDGTIFLNDLLREAPSVELSSRDCIGVEWPLVLEGANATMLDIDVGSYPWCTSSLATIGGVSPGLGVSPAIVKWTIGVAKAYCTRVGEGPFPSEILDDTAELLRSKGREYGTSTGRPRRIGWFDAQAMRFSHAVNAFDSLMITKLDVLTGLQELKIVTAYVDTHNRAVPAALFPASSELLETYKPIVITMAGWSEPLSACRYFHELPQEAQDYVRTIESLVSACVDYIGVGPNRADVIRCSSAPR